MRSSNATNPITIGARSSPLSKAQLNELQQLCPHLTLRPIYVETSGDRDKKTSLRSMDKTDFFTREIDQLQLEGKCRLALHSAKDLPDPLPKGLVLAALTKGLDPSDALVLREGTSLRSLLKGASIATSSVRRERAVQRLRTDLTFVDVRGTIEERLAKLDRHEVGGVVIAEAALIRLHLTERNRVTLPGATVPFQGQLAVIAREKDQEMRMLLANIDSRRLHRIAYFGLDPSHHPTAYRSELFHYPTIRTQLRTIDPAILAKLDQATHVVFTSKTAVRAFVPQATVERLRTKTLIAVGRITAAHLEKYDLKATIIAQQETAEGVIDALDRYDLSAAYIFWPHSSRSRQLIADYFKANRIRFHECIAYDTMLHQPFSPPDLTPIDEIVFTSPSTVDGFLACYEQVPAEKTLTCQGPITDRYLQKWLS